MDRRMSSGLRNLRVLVVEDEPLIVMLIEDALAELDCTVAAVACTVAEGLEKAGTHDFDAAIVDVNLGGASAIPIAELLVRRAIPFVFSTGYGDGGELDSFRGVPVLSKPFKMEEIGRFLEAAMRGS